MSLRCGRRGGVTEEREGQMGCLCLCGCVSECVYVKVCVSGAGDRT